MVVKGNIILVQSYHQHTAQIIVEKLKGEIESTDFCYIITIAGESESGKLETGKAIQVELASRQIKAVVLGQDDYFLLSPRVNDARRRQDVGWLGPHVEIYLPLLEENIIDAINGKKSILRPLIDYDENKILEENVDLTGVEVVIVEGTYTSLLRNAHTRIFIDRDFEETLAHRKERNRGKEVGDPFIEQILATEHKIIAGHKNLANIIITTDYDVIFAEKAV